MPACIRLREPGASDPGGPAGYCSEDLFQYIEEAPDRMCRFAQVEHVDAVNNLEEMVKVPPAWTASSWGPAICPAPSAT